MAKISIHIPDEVLEKVREYKDRLNISKVCSNALLKEVETIANVPPLVEETTKLIERLRKEIQKQHVESFDLGVRLAQKQMSKLSFEQLKFWGGLTYTERKQVAFPEAIEDKLEQLAMEHRPVHRPSFARGWMTIMKRTWETIKDKV